MSLLPHVWLPAIRAGSGSDVFTERLASGLSRRGAKVTVSWYPHCSEVLPDVLATAKAPLEIDIIHANSAYAFAFKKKGIPLVATEHHYVLDPAFRPYKSTSQQLYHQYIMGRNLRRSYDISNAITADSLFTAGVLAKQCSVSVDAVIPLWVDYQKFSPAHGGGVSHSKKIRLLFVGNNSRRKGADLIPALAQKLGPDFEIRCTGGLRDRVDPGLPSNVVKLGRLTNEALVQEYQSCDAALVPSRYEGFGYSALEAMACAKPVVGFRCGAIEELVEDGATGFLCDIDDLNGIETRCRLIAANPELAVELGAAGRERATQWFSEERGIDSYLQMYTKLLS